MAIDALARHLATLECPFHVTIELGTVDRSSAQNRLLHVWYRDISKAKGDMTTDDVSAYCKLHIGVPILRANDDKFREAYDTKLKPLTYEQKTELMREPVNMPVSSRMSVGQFTEYLEQIQRHFAGQGIQLFAPGEIP